MYTDIDWWTKIRFEVLRGETSKREILRRGGIDWETLKKIPEHSEPPGYRKNQPRLPPHFYSAISSFNCMFQEAFKYIDFGLAGLLRYLARLFNQRRLPAFSALEFGKKRIRGRKVVLNYQ